MLQRQLIISYNFMNLLTIVYSYLTVEQMQVEEAREETCS